MHQVGKIHRRQRQYPRKHTHTHTRTHMHARIHHVPPTPEIQPVWPQWRRPDSELGAAAWLAAWAAGCGGVPQRTEPAAHRRRDYLRRSHCHCCRCRSSTHPSEGTPWRDVCGAPGRGGGEGARCKSLPTGDQTNDPLPEAHGCRFIGGQFAQEATISWWQNAQDDCSGPQPTLLLV